MRFVCISDTHNRHDRLEHPVPDGDVLIHAGDATQLGMEAELLDFCSWFVSRPHTYKLLVPGAHDTWCGELPQRAAELTRGCEYLVDRELVLGDVRIYGTPVQPDFYGWETDLEAESKLLGIIQRIPIGLDLLITHVPPFGIRDGEKGIRTGSRGLLDHVRRVRPRYHVFGHVHDGHGVHEASGTMFANAASCDSDLRPCHQPIVIDI